MIPNNFHLGITDVHEPRQANCCIYRLTTLSLNPQGTLTYRVCALVDGKVVEQAESSAAIWDQTGMMYSAYASKILGLTSLNILGKAMIPTESAIQYLGTQIWRTLHSDSESIAVWERWKLEVDSNPMAIRYIVISDGFMPISLPVECIRYSTEEGGEFIRSRNIPILRSYGDSEFTNIQDTKLPSDIIVFSGDEGEDGEALGIKQELQSWISLLQPDRELTEDELNYILHKGETVQGYHSETGQICRITVVPKGDIENLKLVLKIQTEPFMFIYVGHGSYRNNYDNYEDGALVVKPKEYSPDHSRGTLKHYDLMKILRKTPVTAVFLNCCETLRNFETVRGHGEFPTAESLYFDNIEGLKLLSAYRSKVSDLNASLLSQQLVMAVLDKRTLHEYNTAITKENLFEGTGVPYERSLRDYVSRVAVIRSG